MRENVKNFVLVFQNFDNKTCDFWCENGVLKVVTQTITNNAILTTINNPLAVLGGGGRNLVWGTQDQVIKVIQDVLEYM